MAKDFLNEHHTIEKHQPFDIDNSAFKATLSPSGGYLNIELRIKYSFPVGWRLLNPTVSESAFKSKLADMVANVWSGRYAISIEGDSDGRKVRILPSVAMIEVGEGEHFTIDVQRMGSGRSFVTEGRCAFFSGAINYKPSALAMKIGYKMCFGEWSHDRVIYRDAERFVKFGIERDVDFDKNSVEPKNPLRAKMIADAMKEHADVWPLLPLRLTGYRVQGEQAQLSQRRAENLQQKIKLAGAPNVPITIADGGVAIGRALPYVKPEVVNARSDFLNRANNFPIAAHEVGHMLGLADEYNSDTDEDAKKINKYARDNGVDIPPFSQNTSSLMSQGDKFLPYHYITFHHAISTMAATFRAAHLATGGVNCNPTITIVDSLLRKADPTVMSVPDLSLLFEPDA